MLHVGDVFFTGTKESCDLFLACISILSHIHAQFLSVSNDLTFCGSEIHSGHDRPIELTQLPFYSKLSEMHSEDLIKNDTFAMPHDKMARAPKSFVGSCIWLLQTRYDILFEVCNLASNIMGARKSVAEMKVFLKDAKAVYKKIAERHLPLKYSPLPIADGNRRPPLITFFCDAGYASLRASASVGRCVITYGAPCRRNGPIGCDGNAVTFYTREISRVCRSSAHVEGVALANAADLTSIHSICYERDFYQQRNFTLLHQLRDFSLMTPFKQPPCVADIKNEVGSFRSVCKSSNARSSVIFVSNDQCISHVQSMCLNCCQTQGPPPTHPPTFPIVLISLLVRKKFRRIRFIADRFFAHLFFRIVLTQGAQRTKEIHGPMKNDIVPFVVI